MQPATKDALDPIDEIPHVNQRLIVATLVILFVLGGAAWFARSYFVRRNVDTYFHLAQRAEEQGQADRAIQYYTQYIEFGRGAGQFSSANVERRTTALSRIAAILKGRPATADQNRRLYQTYEELLRLNPEQPEVRRDLARLLVQMGRPKDAMEHLQTLLNGAPDGQATAELHYLSGVCRAALTDVAGTQQSLLSSIRQWPVQTASYLALAQLWASNPDRITAPSDDEVPDTESWKHVLDLLRPAGTSTQVNALGGAFAVLQAMQAAAPGTDSALETARFLIGTELKSDRRPQEAAEAQVLTSALLAPAGPDQDQNGVLNGDERAAASVPALSDQNDDGTITRVELQQQYQRGDRLTRLDRAESILKSALAQSENGDRIPEIRLQLIDLYRAKAESAQREFPKQAFVDEAAAARQSARLEVEQGLLASPNDLRFLLANVEIELQSGGAEHSKDQQIAIAKSVEQKLREGLKSLAAEREKSRGATATAQSDWDIPTRGLNYQELEIQIRFALANLLLSEQLLVAESERAALQPVIVTEIDGLRKAGGASSLVGFLDLRRLVADGKYHEATQRAGGLPTELRGIAGLARQATLLLSECYRRSGNPDLQRSVLQNQLNVDIFWADGRRALAESLLSQGQLDKAIDQYRGAIELPGAAERFLELVLVRNARLPVRQRRWEDCDKILTEMERRPPVPPRVLLLAAELKMLQADSAFQRAKVSEDPSLVAEWQLRLQEAEAKLKSAVEASPKEAFLRVAEINFALRRFDLSPEDRLVLADSALATARQELGPSVDLDLAEATIAATRKGQQAGEDLQRLAKSSQSLPKDERIRLLAGLAQVAPATGQRGLMESFWRELIALQPSDMTTRFRLAESILTEFATGQSEFPLAEWNRLLVEIAGLEGEGGANASYLKALRLVREKGEGPERVNSLEQARKLLAVAGKRRASWSAVPRVLAAIDLEQGKPESAKDNFQKANDLGDFSPEVLRGAIGKPENSQDIADGAQFLAGVARENANFLTPDLAKMSVALSLAQKDFGAATQKLGDLASEPGSSMQDQLSYAALRYSTGERSLELRQVLEKATRNNLTAPEPWRALAIFDIQTQAWEQAELTIAEAARNLPDTPNPVATLTVGWLHDQMAAGGAPNAKEHVAQAHQLFQSAVEKSDSDLVLVSAANHYLLTQDLAKADEILSKLLLPTRATTVETRSWASRRQALLIAASNNFDDLQRAIGMLKSGRQNGDKSPENVRLELHLLNFLMGVDTRGMRLELLRELQSMQAITNEEWLQLALLLANGNEKKAAKAELQKLLELQPDFVRGRAAYATLLAQSAANDPKDRELASAQLEELRRIEPGSWRTTLVSARFDTAAGEKEQAKENVLQFLKQRSDGSSNARDAILEAIEQEDVGELLVSLSRVPAIAEDPSLRAKVTVAAQLLRTGERKTAVELINTKAFEPYLGDLRFEVLLQAAALFEDLKFPEAEELYNQYSLKSPRPTAPLRLAQFLIRQQRLPEAFQILEKAWQDVPKLTVAAIVVAAARHTPAELHGQFAPWRERIAEEVQSPSNSDPKSMGIALAQLETMLGEDAASLASFRAAVAKDPKNVAALNNLAYLLARRGEALDEAEKSIDEAIRLEGNVPDLVDTKVLVYLTQGRAAEALALVEPLTARPQAPAALHLRKAECLWKLKKLPEARSALALARQGGFKLDDLLPLDRGPTAAMIRELEGASLQ